MYCDFIVIPESFLGNRVQLYGLTHVYHISKTGTLTPNF